MVIKLRKPRITDLKDFHNIFNDKKVTDLLAGYPYPLTLEKAKNKLQEIIKLNNKGNYYEFAIIFNKKFVGTIALENPSKDKKTFSLGYAIGRKYWGKGITTSAIKKIVMFGFDKLKLKKIISDNDEDNPASGRVLEKNDFKLIKKISKKRGKKRVNVLFWAKKK